MLREEDILKGCKLYNKAAQMALYKKYAGKMNALCYRYVNSYDDAKDVCQDGFVKVFTCLGSFNGKGSLEGWIRKIMVNTAIDYLHRKKSHIFIPFEDTDSVESEQFPDKQFPSESEEEEGIDEAGITNEELIKAISQLPEIFQLVFNMHCIEDYSHKEISELLSIKEETSRSRLRRARKILRENITQIINSKEFKKDIGNKDYIQA